GGRHKSRRKCRERQAVPRTIPGHAPGGQCFPRPGRPGDSSGVRWGLRRGVHPPHSPRPAPGPPRGLPVASGTGESRWCLIPTGRPGRRAMGILEFLILLLIAGVCGAVAQAIAGLSRGGLLVAIAVGFIGALLGTWLQRQTGLPEIFTIDVGGAQFPIVWSIIGGVLFSIVVVPLTPPRPTGWD